MNCRRAPAEDAVRGDPRFVMFSFSFLPFQESFQNIASALPLATYHTTATMLPRAAALRRHPPRLAAAAARARDVAAADAGHRTQSGGALRLLDAAPADRHRDAASRPFSTAAAAAAAVRADPPPSPPSPPPPAAAAAAANATPFVPTPERKYRFFRNVEVTPAGVAVIRFDDPDKKVRSTEVKSGASSLKRRPPRAAMGRAGTRVQAMRVAGREAAAAEGRQGAAPAPPVLGEDAASALPTRSWPKLRPRRTRSRSKAALLTADKVVAVSEAAPAVGEIMAEAVSTADEVVTEAASTADAVVVKGAQDRRGRGQRRPCSLHTRWWPRVRSRRDHGRGCVHCR